MRKKIADEKLEDYLRELHLPTMRKRYREVASMSTKESLSYEDFLRELLREESESRRERRSERFLKASRIPASKNIDNFDMKRLPAKAAQQIKTLLTGCFADHAENVLIFGTPGSGKTHLLCAIGQELIKRDRKVLFTTCGMLVQELLQSKRDLSLARTLKKLSKFDALIIDEIGYVQQDREEMEVLFTLLAERYERQSIMLSSNFPFSKWEKIFKDPMVTAAAIDRLVHHSVIVELNLASYRIDQAKNHRRTAENSKPAKELSTV